MRVSIANEREEGLIVRLFGRKSRKVEVEDPTLVLRVEGRVATDNAQAFADEIKKILDSREHTALILDTEGLEFMASSGLRVLLTLAKTEKDFKIVNVSNDIYQVFEMTGFTRIMNIEKGLKHIEVENADFVGELENATVYCLGRENMVKVYSETVSRQEVEEDIARSKQALVEGKDVPIAFEVVDCGSKHRLGIVFEWTENWKAF